MMRQALLDGGPGGPSSSTASRTSRTSGYRDAARGLGGVRGVPGHVHPDRLAAGRPVERRLDRPDRTRRIDRRPGLRGARADRVEHDRLHLRQPGHDPGRRGDPPGPRLPRAVGQEGALLAEGQGAAGRDRRRDRRERRRVVRQTRPCASTGRVRCAFRRGRRFPGRTERPRDQRQPRSRSRVRAPPRSARRARHRYGMGRGGRG